MSHTLNTLLRRRLLMFFGLIFTLWASWRVSIDEVPDKTVSGRTASVQRRAGSKPAVATPSLTLDWPERSMQHQPVADLFSLAPPPVVIARATSQPSPPMPVFKFKYVGQLDAEDNHQAFLADDKDQVITVKVGQTLADGWQLTTMNEKQLNFRHTITGQEHTMPTGTLP